MIKLTKMIGIPLLLVVIMTTSNTSLAEEKRTLEEIVVYGAKAREHSTKNVTGYFCNHWRQRLKKQECLTPMGWRT